MKPKFLKEWNPSQFKLIELAIVKHFKGRKINTLHGYYLPPFTLNQLDTIFGLAYTSTGIFACYGVCNTEVYFDVEKIYKYSYFVIDEDGNCYAILDDVNEKEIIINF